MEPEKRYNLLDERWITVVEASGRHAKVGLLGVFRDARKYHRITDPSPATVFALYRILLAILSRALPGGDMPPALPVQDVINYLEKWREKFWLFHPQHPFMQVAGIKGKEKSWTELSFSHANGNNATLYDHSMDEQPVTISCEKAANLLVGAQQFACRGLKPKIDGDGEDTGVPGAVLDNKIVALAIGDYLEETLLWNVHLQDKRRFPDDKPCWEESREDRKYRVCKGPSDSYANRHLAYRFIYEEGGINKVVCDGGYVVKKDEKDENRRFQNFRDPMTTIIKAKDAPKALAFDKKSPWQNFPSLVRKESGPQVLRWALGRVKNDNEMVPIIVGGISCKNARIDYWLEAFYKLPKVLLERDGLVEFFEDMMKAVEKDIKFMKLVIKEIEKNLRISNKKIEVKIRAERKVLIDQYMSLMESNFSQLLEALSDDREKAENVWVEKRKESIHKSWEEHKCSMGGSYQALIQIAKINGRMRGYIGRIKPASIPAD